MSLILDTHKLLINEYEDSATLSYINENNIEKPIGGTIKVPSGTIRFSDTLNNSVTLSPTGTEKVGGIKIGTLNGEYGYWTNANDNSTFHSFRQPTGNAVAAEVLSGKTFANASADSLTGSMANNGAVSGSISISLTSSNTGSGSYTVPVGYHNGSGTVTASATAKRLSDYRLLGNVSKTSRTSWATSDATSQTSGSSTDFLMIRNGGTGWVNSSDDFLVKLSSLGNVTSSYVLSGYTYTGSDAVAGSGGMTNRGAVSGTSSATAYASPLTSSNYSTYGRRAVSSSSSYTITAGYHNGSGTVTASHTTYTPILMNDYTTLTASASDLSIVSRSAVYPYNAPATSTSVTTEDYVKIVCRTIVTTRTNYYFCVRKQLFIDAGIIPNTTNRTFTLTSYAYDFDYFATTPETTYNSVNSSYVRLYGCTSYSACRTGLGRTPLAILVIGRTGSATGALGWIYLQRTTYAAGTNGVNFEASQGIAGLTSGASYVYWYANQNFFRYCTCTSLGVSGTISTGFWNGIGGSNKGNNWTGSQIFFVTLSW